ncbi:MAG TPA: hypothetical protein VM452_08430 [Caulifigura sp.]|nr:hypothetical protein [Caulifigura sp.]
MDERYCAIGQSYASFRNLVPQLDSLWSTEFESRSDEEILTFLDDALYREPIAHDVPDRTALKVAADAALAWGRFDLLSNWGPQFDECRAFILCPPGDDIVILSRNLPEDAGIRVSVTRTSFLLATEGFIRWFEDESRRLAIPY